MKIFKTLWIMVVHWLAIWGIDFALMTAFILVWLWGDHG